MIVVLEEDDTESSPRGWLGVEVEVVNLGIGEHPSGIVSSNFSLRSIILSFCSLDKSSGGIDSNICNSLSSCLVSFPEDALVALVRRALTCAAGARKQCFIASHTPMIATARINTARYRSHGTSV